MQALAMLQDDLIGAVVSGGRALGQHSGSRELNHTVCPTGPQFFETFIIYTLK